MVVALRTETAPPSALTAPPVVAADVVVEDVGLREGQRTVGVDGAARSSDEPCASVRPEMVTADPPVMLKMREASLPDTVSVAAPGPLMVRFLANAISPVVSVMVPVTEKSMVSPGAGRRDLVADKRARAGIGGGRDVQRGGGAGGVHPGTDPCLRPLPTPRCRRRAWPLPLCSMGIPLEA